MLSKIKKNFPNIYIIIIAISIAIWFQGINFIVNSLLKPSIKNGAILSAISLFIFYMDDYNLSELYNYNPNQKDNLIRHGPANIFTN